MASSHSSQAVPGITVRWGLRLIPLAGIAIAVLTLPWLMGSSGTPDPAGAAREMASVLGIVVFGWLYFAALIALILGLQALYGALAADRRALGGLALGVASVSVLLTALGAASLGGAVVADSYLRGNTGALDALKHLSGGSFGTPLLTAFLVAVILAAASASLTGIALWRTATPRWATISFGTGFVLVVLSFPIATSIGGLLLAVSGALIARALGRETRTDEPVSTALQPA